MKPLLITILLLMPAFACVAQKDSLTTIHTEQGSFSDPIAEQILPLPKHYPPSFSQSTKLLSFGLGFPNIRRLNYPEPTGYTHIKTTGFGPIYIKFEKALAGNVAIVASYGYGTFHYSYFGWNYFPGYKEQVIYYDEAYNMSIGLSGNYHFKDLVKNPRLDVYAGAGICLDYGHYQYGNIAPYREPETKTGVSPIARIGARYFADRSFGIFGEAGYDGLSILQLGFLVRF